MSAIGSPADPKTSLFSILQACGFDTDLNVEYWADYENNNLN